MQKIRIAEIFYSIQGEGQWAGVPSIFLRTFGCNFKCAGFGMQPGAHTDEPDKIYEEIKDNLDQHTYETLPLAATGCDSYASWHKDFKQFSPWMTIDEITDKIVNLLPHKKFQGEHLIITGGEPLLSWQRVYPALLDKLQAHGLEHITWETNGTQQMWPELSEYLQTSKLEVTYSISAKLPCSGEPWDKAIKPTSVDTYKSSMDHWFLKFVVADEMDLKDAEKAVDEFQAGKFDGPIYLMPLGGVESIYNYNAKTVAEIAMNKGWRYSPRLQVDLWKNAWGT